MRGRRHPVARPSVGRPRARSSALFAILLLTGCGGGDTGGDPGAAAPASSTSTAAATDLPEAEDVSGSPDALRASPYPDYALAAAGLVWIGNVEPGLVGFDPTTAERRVEVPTGRIKVAMEEGLGALWVAEVSGGYGTALLRVDPATGDVLSRTPAPGGGIVSNSSLAVAADRVWALTGFFEDLPRTLVEFGADGAMLDLHPAPDGGKAVRGGFGSLWITDGTGVVRMDPTDLSTEATIETGRGAAALTVSEDAVWVLNTLEGTVSHIDPREDAVVATVTASDGAVARGDIAAGAQSVWVRTSRELATEIDVATNTVVRVLGPAQNSGSVAIAEGTVWITTQGGHVIYRLPAR